MLNKLERNGTVDQVKGRVKQAVGTLTGDDALKRDGQVDETVGAIESAAGRTARTAGDAVARAADAIKKG